MSELSNSQAILADLAGRIRSANEAVIVSQQTTAEKAVDAGVLLIEAKATCRHGEWLPFLDRAGVKERTARNYIALARSGLQIGTVADLGINGTLAFLAKWKMPSFDDAMFISDPEYDTGERSVGRGVAYVWEDETRRGHYHVGMIVTKDKPSPTLLDEDNDDWCIATKRPMLPMVKCEGERPINTIIAFMTMNDFTLPIDEWQISYVDKRLPSVVLPPFFAEETFRDGMSPMGDISTGEAA